MYFPPVTRFLPVLLFVASVKDVELYYFNTLRNPKKHVVFHNRLLKADCLNYEVFFQV